MQLNKTVLQLIKDHLFTSKNWTCLTHTVELTATSPNADCFSPTLRMLYLIQLAGKAQDMSLNLLMNSKVKVIAFSF